MERRIIKDIILLPKKVAIIYLALALLSNGQNAQEWTDTLAFQEKPEFHEEKLPNCYIGKNN